MMLRKIFAVLVILIVLPMAAGADLIFVTGSDLVGSRSTPGGVTGINQWSSAEGGFKIAWNISYDLADGWWDYSYTFTDANDDPINPNLSHWILEVSPFITDANLGQYIFGANSVLVGPQLWPHDPNSPNTLLPGGGISGNANLPVDFYGLKFDTGTGDGGVLNGTYIFSSYQPPIWGDFYAKCGQTTATAWNAAIAPINIDINPVPADGPDFALWVPTPDTGDDPIPEPTTLLLFSSGVLGLGGLSRFRLRLSRRNRRSS